MDLPDQKLPAISREHQVEDTLSGRVSDYVYSSAKGNYSSNPEDIGGFSAPAVYAGTETGMSARDKLLAGFLDDLSGSERLALSESRGALPDLVNQMGESMQVMRALVKAGSIETAQRAQGDVVRAADRLPQQLLDLELRAMQGSGEDRRNPKQFKLAQQLSAAPMVERIRQSMLHMLNRELLPAENLLGEALRQPPPAIAMEDPDISAIYSAAVKQKQYLETTRLLLPFFEKNFSTIDRSGDGYLNRDELMAAYRSPDRSDTQRRVLGFALNNYDSLSALVNESILWSGGLSLQDIAKYNRTSRPWEFQ